MTGQKVEDRRPHPVRDGLDELVRGLNVERYAVHRRHFDDTPEVCAERRAVLAEAVRWYNAHHRGRR